MNILSLMKNAKKMSEMMQTQQDELANTIVTGEAAAGDVTIEMTGKYQAKDLNIADELMGDKAVVQELVVAAVNNAVSKVEAMTQEKMMNATDMLGGAGLGDLMKDIDGKE